MHSILDSIFGSIFGRFGLDFGRVLGAKIDQKSIKKTIEKTDLEKVSPGNPEEPPSNPEGLRGGPIWSLKIQDSVTRFGYRNGNWKRRLEIETKSGDGRRKTEDGKRKRKRGARIQKRHTCNEARWRILIASRVPLVQVSGLCVPS